jgi:Fe2+ or Zn2+ uptake regulation protein
VSKKSSRSVHAKPAPASVGGEAVLSPDMAAKFKDSGLRMTQSRLKILGVLQNTEKALSPGDLFSELNRKFKKENFDRVTVYRILEKFEELEIVHPVGDGKYIYCVHQACEHDKHFIAICEKCHKVQEIGGEAKALRMLSHFLEEEGGFRMTSDSIVVRGLCSKCR